MMIVSCSSAKNDEKSAAQPKVSETKKTAKPEKRKAAAAEETEETSEVTPTASKDDDSDSDDEHGPRKLKGKKARLMKIQNEQTSKGMEWQ